MCRYFNSAIMIVVVYVLLCAETADMDGNAADDSESEQEEVAGLRPVLISALLLPSEALHCAER